MAVNIASQLTTKLKKNKKEDLLFYGFEEVLDQEQNQLIGINILNRFKII